MNAYLGKKELMNFALKTFKMEMVYDLKISHSRTVSSLQNSEFKNKGREN